MQWTNCILIDFDDSFTHNIAYYLHKNKLSFDVVHWTKLGEYSHIFEYGPQKMAVILGPGPGHPDEYSEVFPLVNKMLQQERIFTMGICLGHQIIWRGQNYRMTKSKNIIHGQAIRLRIPPWSQYFPQTQWGRSTYVQRYNSLVVDNIENNKFGQWMYEAETGECMGGILPQGITYQFHPESVGTDEPSLFFSPLLNFFNDHPLNLNWSNNLESQNEKNKNYWSLQ